MPAPKVLWANAPGTTWDASARAKIDNAAKKVGDKMEEAGDKVKDAVKK